jgi:hypothetical protein
LKTAVIKQQKKTIPQLTAKHGLLTKAIANLKSNFLGHLKAIIGFYILIKIITIPWLADHRESIYGFLQEQLQYQKKNI